MTHQLTKFDAADYLDDAETQAHFINAALESGNPDHIIKALSAVARARGVSSVAEKAGITRQGLHKALGESGNPSLSTLLGITRALGLSLAVKGITQDAGEVRQ